jgi:hypothetical protein
MWSGASVALKLRPISRKISKAFFCTPMTAPGRMTARTEATKECHIADIPKKNKSYS